VRCADPDGDYLDIEDVRMVWEEFVDALRDATGAAHDAPVSPENAKSYDALEKPVMKRNQSFSRLAMDLAAAASVSPVASPEGSTRGIERISSSGMLLGIGCSSREPSLRGGNAFFSASSSASAGVRAEDVARALAADGK
jgi:hypothetical protein